jgi:uncharacterized protein (TIGR00266 family)
MMNFEISGVISQYVTVNLEPGESCWTMPGGMISFDGDVDWAVRVPGGVTGAIKRIMSGENFKMTYITAKKQGGKIHFNSNLPGKVYAWDLKNGDVITTRGSFIGAVGDIDISVTVAKKAGAALFGGAGLILQTITGTGTVFVHGLGDFIEYDLTEQDSMQISSGNLAAFSRTADYDIKSVGSIGKTIFGGEGLFMTKISGPGKVLLQSMKKGSESAALAAAMSAV